MGKALPAIKAWKNSKQRPSKPRRPTLAKRQDFLKSRGRQRKAIERMTGKTEVISTGCIWTTERARVQIICPVKARQKPWQKSGASSNLKRSEMYANLFEDCEGRRAG